MVVFPARFSGGATPFVTVVSIQDTMVTKNKSTMSKASSSAAAVGNASSLEADDEGPSSSASCGKIVASSTSKHLVRRVSSSKKTSKQAGSSKAEQPGYITVLEIGSTTTNNNNNHVSRELKGTAQNRSSSASSAGTVTVQIKTNKSGGIRRSASASSGGSSSRASSVTNLSPRKRLSSLEVNAEKSVQTLPNRKRRSLSTETRNVSSVEEDIVIYRLPGEKLGLGLRFDGGSRANELVQRLFVQCCSKGSPSARTKCTWGSLSDGDEIISISGKLVRRMTRVDCVKALKGKKVMHC